MSIGRVTTASMTRSSIFAGVNPALTTLPTAPTDFVNDASIASVKIKGAKGSPGPFFSASNIAASTVGKVSLKQVEFTNGGTPFGIAGTTLGKITLVQDGDVFHLPGDTLPAPGDFVVSDL
jgi:hypothetical protein